MTNFEQNKAISGKDGCSTTNHFVFVVEYAVNGNQALAKSLFEVEKLNTNWMKYLNEIVNDDIENIDSHKYKNNKNKIEGNVDKQLSHETLKKNIA